MTFIPILSWFISKGNQPSAEEPSSKIQKLSGKYVYKPQLNVNSPEVIRFVDKNHIIGSSTLSKAGMNSPQAHLERYFFEGEKFSIASYSQNQTGKPLYQTVALYNPSSEAAEVEVETVGNQTNKDVPNSYQDEFAKGEDFYKLNPNSKTANFTSGTDRLTYLLENGYGKKKITIPPKSFSVISTKVFPYKADLTTQAELKVNKGNVQAAVLYTTKELTDSKEIKDSLKQGKRVSATKDKDNIKVDPTPSNKSQKDGQFYYGRVNGVVENSLFKGEIKNNSQDPNFQLSPKKNEYQYAFFTRRNNTLNTGVIDSPEMMDEFRYPVTAYEGQHNFAEMDVAGNFSNPTDTPIKVSLYLDTVDQPNNPNSRTLRNYFKSYVKNTTGETIKEQSVNISQREGQRGKQALIEYEIPPKTSLKLGFGGFYGTNNLTPLILRVNSEPVQKETDNSPWNLAKGIFNKIFPF